MTILFCDLDDTLIDRSASFARWAEEFATCRDLGESALEWLLAIDERGFNPRKRFFSSARERFGLSESVDELIAAYDDTYPRMSRPLPGVPESLGLLRDYGWSIAVVTNGSPRQRHKLEHAGLAGAVDVCCISEVIGFRKPDARIFEIAAQECGESPHGGWMIGDSVADIGGAHAIGIPSAWIDWGRTWTTEDFAPTLTIPSFAKAVEAILAS